MSNTNTNERTLVQLGLATLARELGASDGDVVQIDSDGNVTIAAVSGNGGSSALVVTTIPLSAATLATGSDENGNLELIPAQGAGKLITCIWATGRYVPGTDSFPASDVTLDLGPYNVAGGNLFRYLIQSSDNDLPDNLLNCPLGLTTAFVQWAGEQVGSLVLDIAYYVSDLT